MVQVEVGDVVLLHSAAGTVSVEVVSVTGESALVKHTEAPLAEAYSVLVSELCVWDGEAVALDSFQVGLQLPVPSLARVLAYLRSSPMAASLLQAKALTIDHLVNLCFRCILAVPSAQEAAHTYLCTVLQTCILSLSEAYSSPKLLRFVLGLMGKVMAKGVILNSPVLYEDFVELKGVEASIEAVLQIERLARRSQDYLSVMRLVPVFHTHKLLQSDHYRAFLEAIIAPYRNYHFHSVPEAKHTLRYLEELDHCLVTSGLKVYLESPQSHTLKRVQTAICIDLLAIQPTRFDAIESFSALLKSNSRDKQYRQILQEFSYTEGQLAALIGGLPDYMRDYFIKACCLGSFSIESLYSYLGAEKSWSAMLSAEFFSELLQYNSTQFLRKLPMADIEFCKKCVDDGETQLLSFGIEFPIIKHFYPEFEWNKERLLLLANSKHSDSDKEKQLLEYFRTSQDLWTVLALQETGSDKAKGKLLSLHYNAGVVRSMWVRERSRWRGVPLALFVRIFSEFC